MTACRAIVNTALRQLGVLGSGREARLPDATDTLSALSGLYQGWIASGAFGRLRDVLPTGTDYAAYGGERIVRDSPETLTVTLPDTVSDTWIDDYGHQSVRHYGTVITIETVDNITTVDVSTGQPIGYATTPNDGAVVVITDRIGGQTQTWIYDAMIRSWQSIDNLTLDSQAPRSQDHVGLAACVAMEVSDQFNADVKPATVMAARRYLAAMTQGFSMRRTETCGVYF